MAAQTVELIYHSNMDLPKGSKFIYKEYINPAILERFERMGGDINFTYYNNNCIYCECYERGNYVRVQLDKY